MSGAKDDGIGFLRGLRRRKDHAPVLAPFRDALTREIILTERLRVKAVIITVSMLVGVVTILHFAAPSVFDRISHGRFDLAPQYKVYAAFLLFEFGVLYLLTRRLRMHSDVSMARRYLSALIETSLPTYLLYLHMNWMGSTQALGYTAPLGYFLFIVLSTLRLDFWLSAFTGFVAAAELFAMAQLYRPAGFAAEPPPELGVELIRSVMFLVGGILAGAVGVQLRRQFEASIGAATARDRVTNLFGQHVSPEVVEQLLLEGGDASSNIRRVAVMFGRCAGARAPGSGRSARWRVRDPGRYSGPPWRHREQVSRRWVSGAVRRADRDGRRRAACGCGGT